MGCHIKLIPTKKYRLTAMVKEALDNLPSGICYFTARGVPLLINKSMYRLMYRLTGQDIQDISDFNGVLDADGDIRSDDGRIWHFQKKNVGDDGQYIEIIASDTTELTRKKQELEKSTAEQQDLMRHLEEISKNVVSITRNEEILAMKMHIHSELGYALAETRRFIMGGCAPGEKEKYIASHRNVAKKLLREIGNNDEIDIFSELMANAEKIGAKIVLDGTLPKFAEGLLTKAVRECLINAMKHGDGDTVFIRAITSADAFTATITNNGRPPAKTVTEGGGLLSIRQSIGEAGGTVTIESTPRFVMKVTLPLPAPGTEIL